MHGQNHIKSEGVVHHMIKVGGKKKIFDYERDHLKISTDGDSRSTMLLRGKSTTYRSGIHRNV